MLVSRLPNAGKRLCLAVSQTMMIGINGLLIQGSWVQARINWDVEAPVTGLPMAVVYASGIAFGLPATLILLHALWRTVSGDLSDAELVMVQESEDLANLPGAHNNAAGAGKVGA
jgi:TRAP-type transport system small permease protein